MICSFIQIFEWGTIVPLCGVYKVFFHYGVAVLYMYNCAVYTCTNGIVHMPTTILLRHTSTQPLYLYTYNIVYMHTIGSFIHKCAVYARTITLIICLQWCCSYIHKANVLRIQLCHLYTHNWVVYACTIMLLIHAQQRWLYTYNSINVHNDVVYRHITTSLIRIDLIVTTPLIHSQDWNHMIRK